MHHGRLRWASLRPRPFGDWVSLRASRPEEGGWRFPPSGGTRPLTRQPFAAGARHDLLQEGPSMPGRRNPTRTPARRRPRRGRRPVHRRRGGAAVDAAGLLAAAAFVCVLVPQARQWLQLHGADIAADTVAVLAAGALTLLLVKAARCGASAWTDPSAGAPGWLLARSGQRTSRVSPSAGARSTGGRPTAPGSASRCCLTWSNTSKNDTNGSADCLKPHGKSAWESSSSTTAGAIAAATQRRIRDSPRPRPSLRSASATRTPAS